MIAVGIALDDWKLPIFKTILEEEGFSYTVSAGPASRTTTLVVETETADELLVAVKRAGLEAAKSKNN